MHSRGAHRIRLWLAGIFIACATAATAASPGGPSSDGEWRAPARDPQNTRYSPLADIDTGNVKDLSVSFTFSTGVLRGHEAAPIVVDDTMYVVTPYPNVLYALDLMRPGAPLKWKYDPKPKSASQGVACCDFVNRGVAYADDRLFYNTLDATTVAIDARTGRELWRRALGDINVGETMTMAPLVVGNKVLVGNSGGEFGIRGWVVALDVRTGATIWKAYSTGPDADVLIGDRFKPSASLPLEISFSSSAIVIS